MVHSTLFWHVSPKQSSIHLVCCDLLYEPTLHSVAVSKKWMVKLVVVWWLMPKTSIRNRNREKNERSKRDGQSHRIRVVESNFR